MNYGIAIEAVELFKKTDEFSAEAWELRGLNPSDQSTIRKMDRLFSDLCDDLILTLSKPDGSKNKRNVFLKAINRFGSYSFDTEEKEFIADLLFELANITGTDIAKPVSIWMYGEYISSENSEQTIVEILSQACTNCQGALELFIRKKEQDVPVLDWLIVQCSICSAYNLMAFDYPGVKQFGFGKFKVVEMISRTTSTLAQARNRLDELNRFKQN